MANINYSDYEASNNRQTSKSKNNVQFFKLPENGEAIVRFIADSREDFEILTMHEVQVGDQVRKVNCLDGSRMFNSEACPLCGSTKVYSDRWGNEKHESAHVTKFYPRMIEYVNEGGKIVAYPRVWERTFAVAQTLAGFIDNYGPLTDQICKIKRTGAGLETRYEIYPNLSKQVYPDNVYVKDLSLFDGFSVVGGIVLNKTFNEMTTYVQTGLFPADFNAPDEYDKPVQWGEPQKPVSSCVDAAGVPYIERVSASPAPQQQQWTNNIQSAEAAPSYRVLNAEEVPFNASAVQPQFNNTPQQKPDRFYY